MCVCVCVSERKKGGIRIKGNVSCLLYWGSTGMFGGIVVMCWVCRFKKASTLMNERIWFVFITTTILIILHLSVDICNCVYVCVFCL